MTNNYKKIIQESKNSFYHDLNTLIRINSVKGTPRENAPFGETPKQALVQAMNLANEYGFQTKIINNAMGYAQWGEDSNYIGVVGHLDVVPAGDGWTSNPFELAKRDHRLFARGILDNKGPIFANLFGLKLLKDSGFQPSKTIRIIFGTDEESGSADVPLYLEQEKPPVFGYTPDCKYPVVYGERGIVNYNIITSFADGSLDDLGDFIGDQAKDHVPDKLSVSIRNTPISATGKRAPSNAPELGVNAITQLAEKISSEHMVSGELFNYFTWLLDHFLDKHHGEMLGIDFEDSDSGKLMLTPYELQKSGNNLILSIAIRYPVSFEENEVEQNLKEHLPANTELIVTRRIPSTNFPKNNVNIKKLSHVYEKITGLDGTPVTTTGATYARFMPNIVAFGPSFPGQKGIAHNKDEYMDEKDLLLNLEIYTQAIASLIK